MFDVIRPESPVTLAGDIVGGVLQVAIGPLGHVRYEVAFWAAGVRHVQWFEAVEVVAQDPHAVLTVGSRGSATRELSDVRAALAALTERVDRAIAPAA